MMKPLWPRVRMFSEVGFGSRSTTIWAYVPLEVSGHGRDLGDRREQGVAESRDRSRLVRPSRRVWAEAVQGLRECRRDDDVGIGTVEVVAAGWNAGTGSEGVVEDMVQHVGRRPVGVRGAELVAEGVLQRRAEPGGEDHVTRLEGRARYCVGELAPVPGLEHRSRLRRQRV